MNNRKIALIDGDNFFASCEILINPSLRNKPVCVLSNNDGCVIARSREAKQIGVRMGMPYFMAKKEFPNSNIVYISADFSLYHDISRRMMNLLLNYSDIVDIYSIDEAFIDLTNIDKKNNVSYFDFVTQIRKTILEKIGISVSIGLSYSKTLAKIASHKAKNASGIYIINNENIYKELYKVELEEIWGVGKNIARTLRSFGIFYAHEILNKEDEFFKYKFGKKGLELKYELLGQCIIPLVNEEELPKSIQRTRAFPNFSSNKEYIMTELELHLHNVCKKLRENNQVTSIISVMLRTKDFKVFVQEEKLDNATNSEIILKKYIKKLFSLLFNENIVYRSSGILVYSLINKEKSQLSLFHDVKNEKINKLSGTIDILEDKFGNGIIALGQSGIKAIQQEHKRQMKFRPF